MSASSTLGKIIDGIVLLVAGSIGGIVLLLGLLFGGQWWLQQRCEKDKVQLREIFSQMIAEGAVSDVTGGKFRIDQRHIATPFYTISYTNSSGEKAGYFVAEMLEKRGLWEFKELVSEDSRRYLYREKSRKP